MERSLQNYLAIYLLAVFIAAPLRAGSRSSTEAVHWLQKAVASYEREDYGAAKTSLQMALEEEPNFSEAYMLKGLLEYRDGQTEKAQASWKRALELNPRLPEDMRKSLEKRAHGVEQHLTEQDFSHFHLQFNGAEQREQAWQAVKYLDEAYGHMGSQFSIFPEEKFTVIIFTSDEFWEAWNVPMWLGGFFDKRDGRIRIRIDSLAGGDEEYRQRLRHEFTHAYIHNIYPKDLPVWFQEGIAQFYAYSNPTDAFWKDTRMDVLKKQMRNAPWMDMDRLEEVIKKKDVSPGLVYLAYLESEAMILYIAKERGDSWIPTMMDRLRKGASFGDAFKEIVGVKPAESLDHLHQAMF